MDPSYQVVPPSPASVPETAETIGTHDSLHAPNGFMAIVYTEIADAALIWEDQPTAMHEAIYIYESILHSKSHQYEGYQVRGIEDAYLVVFETAKAALQFCLEVQTTLIAADWPVSLLESKYCKQEFDKDYSLTYRGLSVRMAIHWGSPISQVNETSGRMDYSGPLVYKVSRAVEIADRGQIVVTENFLNELEGAARNTKRSPSPFPRPARLGVELSGEAVQDTQPEVPEADRTSMESKVNVSGIKLTALLPVEGPSSAPPPPKQQAFAMKNAGEHKLRGLNSTSVLYLFVPASLASRLHKKVVVEPPATGLQGWWQWAREGVASNASEQNILPL